MTLFMSQFGVTADLFIKMVKPNDDLSC
jgi:hypothetical protein